MRRIGIVQRGAPVLERPARWIDLPEEASHAEEIVARLRDAVDRVAGLRPFRWGAGLCAPQLGIGWAVAVIRPIEAQTPIVLLNPRVAAESADRDEQLEGCLSFFDVRGRVSRPVEIDVEHTTMDGATTMSTFTGVMARVVAHAIDHLSGRLYPDRMPPDSALVPTVADIAVAEG